MRLANLSVKLVTVLTLLMPSTASWAYDTNTLDRHLDSQRWNRLQDHQNRKRMGPNRKVQKRQQATRPRCSADSMPRAERQRIEARAMRIMRSEGREAAVAYARKEGMAYRKKLQRQGICP